LASSRSDTDVRTARKIAQRNVNKDPKNGQRWGQQQGTLCAHPPSRIMVVLRLATPGVYPESRAQLTGPPGRVNQQVAHGYMGRARTLRWLGNSETHRPSPDPDTRSAVRSNNAACSIGGQYRPPRPEKDS